MRLNGTSTLITGASRGLGAALARQLAAEGARVVAVARGREALEQTVAGIVAAGGEAHAFVADIADKEQTYAIAGAAAALVGPVRLLIHNASTLGPVPLVPLLDLDCEALAEVLETNVIGPFRLSKALVGPMVLAGEGTVLQISSDAAVSPYPGWGAYGASKAAMDQLGAVLATELEGTGVRVLAVDPGEMDTVMHHDAAPDADPAELADPEAVAARIVALLRSDTESGSRVVVEVDDAA